MFREKKVGKFFAAFPFEGETVGACLTTTTNLIILFLRFLFFCIDGSDDHGIIMVEAGELCRDFTKDILVRVKSEVLFFVSLPSICCLR